ncbi:MAG: hypothetical protein IKZ05_04085 [Clostridia bacterium]|nr:hypothetical protein [Clostridia bacterium]
MITKNLTKALEEIGFTYSESKNADNSNAYAVYGGYLVSVYEKAGKKIAYINFKFSDNEENDIKKYEMSEAFSAELDEYSVSDYYIDEDGMRVYCSGSIPVFLKLIDRCIALLIENEIKGFNCCSKCGNKFGTRKPKKVSIGCENHLMCEHCTLETIEEVNAKQLEENNESSQPKITKAILFSSLFSVIGLFIYVALYYWLSPAIASSGINEIRYIFCVAGFLTSILAYFGYILFCKKASLAAYITVIVNSVIFTAIGQYLGVVLEFVAKNGFKLSNLSNKHFWLVHLRNTVPADVAAQYTDYSAIFWRLLVISLMFAVVGAAIFLLGLHDKNGKKAETVEVETITIK